MILMIVILSNNMKKRQNYQISDIMSENSNVGEDIVLPKKEERQNE
jgi:hypothetical protein